MGELIRSEPPVMSHTELTTEPPIIRPHFEASSLTNRIEGPSVSPSNIKLPKTYNYKLIN